LDLKTFSQDLKNEECKVLQDLNKDLNKKVVKLYKQVHDLNEQLHLKDQEIYRLKRVKDYKHWQEPRQKTGNKVKTFEKNTQTPYSHVQSKETITFLSKKHTQLLQQK
jgi:hypothetical protein